MDISASPDLPVTRTEAAARLGKDVTPGMVSMWVLRGWTDEHGHHHQVTILGTEGRSRLYRLGDLQQCEKAARRSPNSRRRTAA